MQHSAFLIAIPARYASTRLPGKLLLPLAGEAIIVHVARRALAAGAAEVVVATDDARIADVLVNTDVRVVMTHSNHASGSDRLAECAEKLGWAEDAIIVNLQGDEPLVPISGIRAVAEALADSETPMATLATAVNSTEELFDSNCVKVVCDKSGRALYFSRAPLPWARDEFAHQRDHLPATVPFLRHIGIYAYRAGFLRHFATLPRTRLETAESLEQLRALEHGYAINVALAPEPFPAGIDTAEDLVRADQWLARGVE